MKALRCRSQSRRVRRITKSAVRLACIWIGLLGGMASLHAADVPACRHSFIVIAHRGDHTEAHENTLRAIENAIAAGVDYVELDVRRTRDGHHVLSHDSSVDRMTDGHGKVAELTLDQLRGLQVIDRRRTELPADRMVTLTEVLAVCRDRIHIYLDFKDGDRAEVGRLIREAGMTGRVLVYCGANDIRTWRKAAPALPMIVSPPEGIASNPGKLAAWVKKTRVEVLDGSWTSYSAAAVAAAEKAGARVWPDIQGSQENPEYWEKVVSLGFTGVQTDKPGALIGWLVERQRR